MADRIIAPNVSLVNGNPATTSLAIAECFGKHHKNVLRDIDQLLADCPKEFGRLNFELSSYTNSQGKPQPMYTVFFDGFILLVMGYTGKKALEMKLAYIAAFNAMKAKLEEKTPELESKEERTRRLAKERQIRFRERKCLALESNAMDKYTAYMKEVEAFRATTMAGIERLVRHGLGLMDVYRFGPKPFTPYNDILMRWLMEVVVHPSALFDNGWRNAEYAIEHSPIGLVRELEKALPDMRK